jgi:hypothetical protein
MLWSDKCPALTHTARPYEVVKGTGDRSASGGFPRTAAATISKTPRHFCLKCDAFHEAPNWAKIIGIALANKALNGREAI